MGMPMNKCVEGNNTLEMSCDVDVLDDKHCIYRILNSKSQHLKLSVT